MRRPLLLGLLLSVMWVCNASALQRGSVVIDDRVTITVEVARTRREQAKGLAGRSSLPKGEGMLFPFDAAEHRTFWMKGMLIPLDIVWIREGRLSPFTRIFLRRARTKRLPLSVTSPILCWRCLQALLKKWIFARVRQSASDTMNRLVSA
ncbi:MAG: DUF192 domain-containing protein [Candidatus Methylomirabilis sp.]|nr:DUF192 domain-containing protein [Candidatus Methylomirabilis sp.]